MKRAAATIQPVFALFSALVLVVTLAIAGCTPSTISGPDLAPSDDQQTQVQDDRPANTSATHNEGESAGRGGSGATGTVASRN